MTGESRFALIGWQPGKTGFLPDGAVKTVSFPPIAKARGFSETLVTLTRRKPSFPYGLTAGKDRHFL